MSYTNNDDVGSAGSNAHHTSAPAARGYLPGGSLFRRLSKVMPFTSRSASRWPRVTLTAAALSLLGLGLTPLAPVAPASAAAARYVVYNSYSRYCMTNGGKTGAVVTQYPCNGSANQSWYSGSTHGNYEEIKNAATNQCIGLAGGNLANGAKIQMGACSGNDQYYWERLQSNGSILGYVSPGVTFLSNQSSLRVINLACDCKTNSAPLNDVVQNKGGPASQLWYIDYADQGP